jgi:hypothetical protein
MENLKISLNGLYMVYENSIYSVIHNKRTSLDELPLINAIDILKENSEFAIKNRLVEINDLVTYQRKITYRILENFKFGDKTKLMLEYEAKFGQLLITESNYIVENWLSDAWNWTKEKASQFGNWVVDKVKDLGGFAVKTAKDLLSCIPGGHCSPLFEDFRTMLFSPVGIAVETFLSATGIGDVAPIVAWGIMTLYDGYLLWTKDPSFSWYNLFFDILGIGLGAIAKAARTIFESVGLLGKSAGKSLTTVIEDASKNPSTAGYIQKLGGVLKSGVNKIMSPLQTAGKFMSEKLGLKWVSKILDSFSETMGKILESFGIVAKKGTAAGGVKSAIKSGGLAQAFNVGAEKAMQWKTGMSPVQMKNMETLSKVQQYYGGADPFDR